MSAKKKLRLDELLVKNGLAISVIEARKLILAGHVSVAGQISDKPGSLVQLDTAVECRALSKYVGRGAYKLLAAFENFPINVVDKVCADIGSSTGGFTQVLLEKGAKRVYAIDSAYGELDWKLRQDPRVVVMERTNATQIEGFPEPIDFATIDVSLMSLKVLLPSVLKWLPQQAIIVALLKPQYEAKRQDLPLGAVITDHKLHEAILEDLRQWCKSRKIHIQAVLPSPILGMSGNREFLVLIYDSL